MSTLGKAQPARRAALALALAASLVSPGLLAEPGDAKAMKAGEAAMSRDYRRGRVSLAKRKLQKAIKGCLRKCSKSVIAQLNLDLGIVYIAGLRKEAEGRAAMTKAVEADPEVGLDPQLTTPRVAKIFDEVTSALAEEEEPDESDTESSRSSAAETASEAESSEEPAEQATPESSGGAVNNWFSLSFQQDTLLHRAANPACGATYTCYDAKGAAWDGQVYPGVGNRTVGGLALAGRRLLLGYDRVFFHNLQLGLRGGVSLNAGPNAKSGPRFHAEARAAVFFGGRPFERPGFRPYLAIAGGVAEVDSYLIVEYYRDESSYRARAKRALYGWRRTGQGFVGPSLGFAYGFGAASALTLEARLMVMLGTSGLAPALALGYAHGL